MTELMSREEAVRLMTKDFLGDGPKVYAQMGERANSHLLRLRHVVKTKGPIDLGDGVKCRKDYTDAELIEEAKRRGLLEPAGYEWQIKGAPGGYALGPQTYRIRTDQPAAEEPAP